MGSTDRSAAFEQLDFLYTPSRDVAADLAYFTDVLGGRSLFAIEGMGARVAAVEPTSRASARSSCPACQTSRPRSPVSRRAAGNASTPSRSPHGPICSFRSPGGHRIALYQLTRPEVAEHFVGRRDF